jgi:hypothetical protein
MSEAKAAPLTEDQRTEVRQLLQRLSQQSTARAQRRGTTRPALQKTKRLKREINPFDAVEPNKAINGVVLAADCCVIPFVQRSRIILLPYHLDQIAATREEFIDMMYTDCGLSLSESDEGAELYLRFVVEANPPIRYLHLYLERYKEKQCVISNWVYGT